MPGCCFVWLVLRRRAHAAQFVTKGSRSGNRCGTAPASQLSDAQATVGHGPEGDEPGTKPVKVALSSALVEDLMAEMKVNQGKASEPGLLEDGEACGYGAHVQQKVIFVL